MMVTIRPAELKDSQTLFGLIKANAVELKSVRFLNKLERVEQQLRLLTIDITRNDAGIEIGRKWRYLTAAERIAANVDDPDSLVGYLIAERFSVMLAFVSFYYGESSFYGDALLVEDLFVHPKARRQGIGRALYRAVRAHGEERGKCRLDIRTPVENQGGVAFLKKMAEESKPPGRRVEEWITYRFDLHSHALASQ